MAKKVHAPIHPARSCSRTSSRRSGSAGTAWRPGSAFLPGGSTRSFTASGRSPRTPPSAWRASSEPRSSSGWLSRTATTSRSGGTGSASASKGTSGSWRRPA